MRGSDEIRAMVELDLRTVLLLGDPPCRGGWHKPADKGGASIRVRIGRRLSLDVFVVMVRDHLLRRRLAKGVWLSVQFLIEPALPFRHHF
jgi:hypothetical protein